MTQFNGSTVFNNSGNLTVAWGLPVVKTTWESMRPGEVVFTSLPNGGSLSVTAYVFLGLVDTKPEGATGSWFEPDTLAHLDDKPYIAHVAYDPLFPEMSTMSQLYTLTFTKTLHAFTPYRVAGGCFETIREPWLNEVPGLADAVGGVEGGEVTGEPTAE